MNPPDESAVPAPDSRPRLGRVLVTVWTVLIVVFVVVALLTQWQKLTDYEWQLSSPYLIVVLLAAMLRRLCGGINFTYLLAKVSGRPLFPGFSKIIQAYFVTNMALYLPGTLLYIPWRLKVYREHGISRSHTLVTSGLEASIMVLSHSAVGLPIVLPVLTAEKVVDLRWFLAILCAAVLVIQPPVVRFLFRLMSWALGRKTEEPHLSFRQILVTFAILVVKVFFTGASQFYLIKSLYPELPADAFLFITGGYGLAWSIGFLTPFAPAGMGVREGLLVWFFSHLVPLPVAMVAAVGTRLVFIVEDAAWAGIVILIRSLQKQGQQRA